MLPDVIRHGNAVEARLFRGPSYVHEGAPESLRNRHPAKAVSCGPSFIKQCLHFLQGPCPSLCQGVGLWRLPDERRISLCGRQPERQLSRTPAMPLTSSPENRPAGMNYAVGSVTK